jgi:ferredoxin-NADP reductase
LVLRETSSEGKISAEEIGKIVREMPTAHIYICGPENFENFIVQSLEKASVPKEKIHVERFVQAGALQNQPQTITF